MVTLPKISVITVVYNRIHDIRFTLESVVSQQYSNLEYIVIDGGSADGTKDILKSYASKIDILISEQDEGIYDAMNKGLSKSTGEYVIFINGGDQFYNLTVLYDIFKEIGDTLPDIIYGECLVIDRQRQPMALRSVYYNRPLPYEANADTFRYGTTISHQSFMVRKKLAPMYDLRYRYSSDVDWMLRCMELAKDSKKTSFIISSFVYGDSSKESFEKSQWERFLIFGRHYGWLKTLYYHVVIAMRAARIKLLNSR